MLSRDQIEAKEKIRCSLCQRFLNKRSLEFNAYYWAVCIPLISDFTGDTHEDQHEVLKFKLLPRRFVTVDGQEKEVAKSTADLTSKEFHDYIERVIEFAAKDLQVVIPPPIRK